MLVEKKCPIQARRVKRARKSRYKPTLSDLFLISFWYHKVRQLLRVVPRVSSKISCSVQLREPLLVRARELAEGTAPVPAIWVGFDAEAEAAGWVFFLSEPMGMEEEKNEKTFLSVPSAIESKFMGIPHWTLFKWMGAVQCLPPA